MVQEGGNLSAKTEKKKMEAKDDTVWEKIRKKIPRKEVFLMAAISEFLIKVVCKSGRVGIQIRTHFPRHSDKTFVTAKWQHSACQKWKGLLSGKNYLFYIFSLPAQMTSRLTRPREWSAADNFSKFLGGG